MAFAILGNPNPAYFDTSGAPLVGGTLTIQNPTDSTTKAYYSTAATADANTSAQTSVITLNARGEYSSGTIWGRDNEDYKVIVKDSAGTTIKTIDNIQLPEHPKGRKSAAITDGDGTPSVVDGDYMQITGGTEDITALDAGYTGKIVVLTNTGSTARLIDHGNSIKLKDVDAGGMCMIDDDQLMLISDSSSVWRELARAQRGPLLATKIADQSVDTSTTLIDDTHMAAFQLAPESIYKVRGFLKVNTAASATPDIKLALQTDQTFQDSYWSLHSINDATTIVGDCGVTTTAITLACAANQVNAIKIDGFIQTHATAIATVDLQWAQGTSDAAVTTVELGSWLQFEMIRSD